LDGCNRYIGFARLLTRISRSGIRVTIPQIVEGGED
jgi:hypothetical protein